MKYLYGPVKSRRLGFSLGLSLTPYKICNFDCIYCQLGSTTEKTLERKEYIPISEIINELRLWLNSNPQEAKELNYITLSGSGEPTLNIKIGDLIAGIKNITGIKVAVITNAALLKSAPVRKALEQAELIVPSLDAVSPELFRKIDRPIEGILIEDIIGGLIELRKEFKGRIWLEVMVVKGVNDDLAHIRRLKEVVEKINPDKVQINSPVRTPAEACIEPASASRLKKIKEIIGDKCEII